jgi:hypothetical protein
MRDLRQILNDGEQLNEDELLKYIHDELSEADKRAFEDKAAGSSFINDAVEGLKAFQNKQDLNDYVKQLNKGLENQLAAKKHQQEKRKIKQLPLIFLTVLIILLMCILGYIAIHAFNKSSLKSPAKNNKEYISPR